MVSNTGNELEQIKSIHRAASLQHSNRAVEESRVATISDSYKVRDSLYRGSNNEKYTMSVKGTYMMLIGVCLSLDMTQPDLTAFRLMYTDMQFKRYSVEKEINNAFLRMCVMECHLSGPLCGSFSLNTYGKCSINVLRLHRGVEDPLLVFDSENGTRIYAPVSGIAMLFAFCRFKFRTLFCHII